MKDDEQYIVEALHKAAEDVNPQGRLEDITSQIHEERRSSTLALIGTIALSAIAVIGWLVIWCYAMKNGNATAWLNHQPLPQPEPPPLP